MKNIAFILALVATVILSVTTGCKKKDNTTPATTGHLWFHIHTNIDTAEADLDATYAEPDSSHTHFRNIMLHSGTFTINNIKLIKTDGTVQAVSATVNGIAGTEQYQVADVPTGTYKSVTFDVTAYSVQGMTDTSLAGTGMPMVNWSFQQTGTATVVMPDHATVFPSAGEFTVGKDSTKFIHMIGDYAVLLRGIDLRTTQSNTAATTARISANIPNMFQYEE